ncbi:MAG: hypothetical protein A3H94_03435 [Acidobacteria bacterium RIFCSPLOWO2_02_FULL_60_20]|nr:MAG: hypothetical protein A3H94_03435 [Acidobacteria bacterium RIFCSPLOWO2_02_FULL_60_20]
MNQTMRNEMRETRWRTLCVAACLCLGAAVAAAETIKQNFPTSANPSFLLHNHTGKISIEGWDQHAIDIQGEPASNVMEVIIMGGEQKVSVQVHPKRERFTPKEARLDFEIRVPRQAIVRVDSERGDIVVKNLAGSITIEGVSTPVALSQMKGHITVRTVDGPILIQSAEGSINADSISGDLRFVQVNGSELVANTNSGAIRYEGDFGDGGTYVLNNYSSPIDIFASAKASFDLTARAVMGLIESSLSFRPTPLGNPFRRLSPNKFLQGRFNSGESTVRVTSYSGTIRVRGPRSEAQAQ